MKLKVTKWYAGGRSVREVRNTVAEMGIVTNREMTGTGNLKNLTEYPKRFRDDIDL